MKALRVCRFFFKRFPGCLLAASLLTVASTASARTSLHTSGTLSFSSRIISMARTMTDRFGSTSGSCYSHKTDYEPSHGICKLDCSGLVAVILKRVSPKHLTDIPKPAKRHRPLAEDFEKAFETATTGTLPGWKGIVGLSRARPGDIIAWRIPGHAKGADTGHTMIVASRPVRVSDHLWKVRIIDSTKSGHANDTRTSGVTGIGSGNIWFETDKRSHPVAYHWRLPKGRAHRHPIAMGRAVPYSHQAEVKTPDRDRQPEAIN